MCAEHLLADWSPHYLVRLPHGGCPMPVRRYSLPIK